jgi:hypothetical protein
MTRVGNPNSGGPSEAGSGAASVPTPELLAAFERYLTSERRYSPHTLTAYRRDVEILRSWCASQNLTELTAVRRHHIRHCLAQLHARGRASASLRRWLASVRALFRFALREGLATDDPCTGIRAPRGPRKLPGHLDVGQLHHRLAPPRAAPANCRGTWTWISCTSFSPPPATISSPCATAPWRNCFTRLACAWPNSPLPT